MSEARCPPTGSRGCPSFTDGILRFCRGLFSLPSAPSCALPGQKRSNRDNMLRFLYIKKCLPCRLIGAAGILFAVFLHKRPGSLNKTRRLTVPHTKIHARVYSERACHERPIRTIIRFYGVKVLCLRRAARFFTIFTAENINAYEINQTK